MHAEKVSSALAAWTQSLQAAASAAKYSKCSSQPSILSCLLHRRQSRLKRLWYATSENPHKIGICGVAT